MSATTVISLYAAGIATASLAWPVLAWRRAHESAVAMQLGVSRVHQPTEQLAVHVRVVNRSDHQVTVQQVTVEGIAPDGIPMAVSLGAWDDRAIPPLDGAVEDTILHDVDNFDPTRPLVARALLTTGDSFESGPATVPRAA